MNMNEFLLKYYRQLNFKEMPPEVRAQFDVYRKADNGAGDFRGNMKEWADLYDPVTGDALPPPNATDPAVMDPGEWEKLFKAFQDAFRSMDAARSSFEDNKKATDFLNEYFGHDPATGAPRLFTLATANSAAAAKILSLQALLTTHARSMSIYLEDWKILDDNFTWTDLISGLASGKYNKDNKFQEKLKEIAKRISHHSQHDKTLQTEIGIQDFSAIENGFDDSSISTARLDFFKIEYKSMLNRLYKETKIREVFAEHDNGKISKPLNKAIGKTDYNNKESKDYIPPKRTDQLTLGQQISKWAEDTYEDCLEKYVTLKGDKLYFSPSAKFIVKAIDGAGIKPTDGLGKVLDETKKIKDNLTYKSPKATEHFDYFVEVMNELKDTMPKAFAGAMHNGIQLRALVEEMAMHAVRNGKVEEAKTAMEVLSVIRYGYTTSKIMDTIRKEPMSIFGDKSLTWNKNAGVQFVTNAIDKSIKFAVVTAGYGITIAGNTIKRTGTKFKHKDGALMGKANAWDGENATDKAKVERSLLDARTKHAAADTELHRLDAAGFNAGNIATHQSALERHQTRLNRRKQRLEELNDEQDELNQEITKLTRQIAQYDAWIAANPIHPDLADIQDERRKLNMERDVLLTDQRDIAAQIRTVNHQITILEPTVTNLNDRITEFTTATTDLAYFNSQVDARQTEFDTWDDKHKNQYMELMAHWDFMTTGTKTHSFALGKKSTKQKNLDSIDPATGQARRLQILNDYYNQYAA